MVSLSQLIKLIRLAGLRLKSKNDYFKFQQHQARLIISELKTRKIDIKSMNMLEIGCGTGGYSTIFLKHAKEFTASDLEISPLLFEKHPEIKFIQFDATKKFPIIDNAFDIVFCGSTIEHVEKPLFMLCEIRRILNENGVLILTFPPFYSPVGSHMFKPFHYLGEKTAIRLTNLLKGTSYESYKKAFGSWGLYTLKISDVEKLLKQSGYKIVDKWTRFSPINTAKIPLFREFLTWHVNFICKK